MDKPLDLTDNSFNEEINKHQLLVVDCWAPWCGPCKMLSPIIDELASELSGKIAFGKLNIDENAELAGKYGIMSIPTLLVFKEGELVDQIVGALPKDSILEKLSKYRD